MKRWIALTGIVALGLVAIVVVERHKVDTPVSPAALLYLVADTEQELTRMPVSFTRMSDRDEIRIGDEIAKASYGLQQNGGDKHAAEIQAYVTQVGSSLATRAHRKLPYRFHYVPEKSFINAFALPGGHVYVGAGLLSMMDSEDELAAVLGHEIEHVDHYHCAERVQQEQALHKLPFGALFALPVELFEAGYSKDQELEADREGTRLAVEAGYSANGAIRMFETFQRLEDEYHSHARTPRQEVSQVTIDTLEGYFRSHPLPSERIAQVNRMIANEGWPVRPERDLMVAYIFSTQRAESALLFGKYTEAQGLASQSLKTHPDDVEALVVLAQAQFAQADFADAASSYRKVLERRGRTTDVVDSYALSLAAANRQTAANEFRQWMASAKGDTHELKTPMAGLLLLQGDAVPIRQREAEVRAATADPSAPNELSDMGWWFYIAGDYPAAERMLRDAVQQRPSNISMALRLGWADIELRQLADALTTINTTTEEPALFSERSMARAVARWQAQDRDIALSNFVAATIAQSEWKNSHWVKMLYSPLVESSIEEMQTELERRKKVAQAARRER